MRRLVVEISDHAFDRLVRDALRERRPTRDQAAVLLERAVGESDADSRPSDQVPRLGPGDRGFDARR